MVKKRAEWQATETTISRHPDLNMVGPSLYGSASTPSLFDTFSDLNDNYLQSKEKRAEDVLYGDGTWPEIESGVMSIVVSCLQFVSNMLNIVRLIQIHRDLSYP